VRTSDTGFRVVVSAAEDPTPRVLLAESQLVVAASSPPLKGTPDLMGTESSPERVEAALGLDAEDRQEIRSQLLRLGLDPGPSDEFSSWVRAHLARLGAGQPAHDLGQQARDAIATFQKSKGLAPTGYITASTREALRAAVDALAAGGHGAAKDEAQDAQRLAKERLAAERQQAETERLAEVQRRTEARGRADAQRRARLAALGYVLPAMIELPGGTFRMGSPETEKGRTKDESPRHRVTLKPFAIGQTEVTFAQYDTFARATGRRMPRDQGAGRGARPVVDVSWLDANAYAAWLGEQTGDGYRLPSEAEWEYAARAGSEAPFWSGACLRPDQAIYDSSRSYPGCPPNPKGPRRPPVSAGSLPANPWGLHEVAGNVAEWVQDCWHPDYRGAPADGKPWLQSEDGDCAVRVVRGGGWSYVPWALRSAYRSYSPGASGQDAIGFRVARSLWPAGT
jgi:formylglycine-generating enzyme required for sulfatase activity